MAHALFKASLGWDLKILHEPMCSWDFRSFDARHQSEYHDAQRNYVTLNSWVVKALEEYVKGPASKIAAMAVARGDGASYSTEWKKDDGDTILFQIMRNGYCRGAIKTQAGLYTNLPGFGDANKNFDATSIILAVLLELSEISATVKDKLEQTVTEYNATGELSMDACYYLSDAVYYAVNTSAVPVTMPGGNVNMLPEQSVRMGNASGTTVCGVANELAVASGTASSTTSAKTFAEAKAMFKEWSDTQTWAPEEEEFIPSFPDDYPVPPEAIKIASRYINTHNSIRPMLNFMWRGITSYGKSTGVELIAAMLHMPLLRMTCHTTMETQDFLSNIVPVNDRDLTDVELPSFTEIAGDPESAYFALTGKSDPNATPDMCLEAYASVVAERANQNNGQLFKQVESNFVKALERGYIVEVQEISRIKDSGVLVGLNEYDKANAVIPLVNGKYVRRHPNAMVIYTDNVGYVSCRAIDPSVLRRMAFILDSYEIPKETALARIKYNTGFQDESLLESMYEVWDEISKYCTEKDITEGTVSLTELEMWAQSVMADGYSNIEENCMECVVAKATSVISEQKEIRASVLAVHLAA